MKKVTKFQLADAFFHRYPCNLYDSNNKLHSGIISSIQHEDGSRSSFNITLEDGQKFHLRTID